MIPQRYNISAGYDLAESAVAAIKGHYDEVYLEDFVEPDTGSFWARVHKPQKRTALHTLLTNWEYSRWEDRPATSLPAGASN